MVNGNIFQNCNAKDIVFELICKELMQLFGIKLFF